MRSRALVAIACYAVLAAWAPLSWAVSLPGAAFLVLALLSLRSGIEVDALLLPTGTPLAMALIGCAQLLAGVSVYRFPTEAAILFWMVCAAVAWLGSRTRADGVLAPLSYFSGCIAVLAILVHFTSTFRIFWLIPAQYAQVFGPYVYRNHYAAFAELMLPVALYLACAHAHARALHIFIAVALFAGVIVAESRSGFVLCTAEIVVVLALAFRRGLLSARGTGVVAIALLAGCCTVGIAGLAGRMQEEHPYQVRGEIVQASLAMWQARPVLGLGLGTWRSVYPSYARMDPGVMVNEAHNDWVQWACDGGLFAELAMLALALWCARQGVRTVWGLGAAFVFLHALIDYPFQEPSIVFLTMLLAGLMCKAPALKRVPQSRGSR